MKSIYLNSFQVHGYQSAPNGVVVHSVDGLSFPELRLQTYNRPGEYGSFIANNLYGGRPITLEGTIFSDITTTFEQRKRALEAILAISKNSLSQYLPLTLQFTTMDDLALQVDVGVRNFNTKYMQSLNAIGFQLILYAPDYFLSSQNQGAATIARPIGGGAILPVILPVTLDPSSGGSQVILNAGNAESFPIIYINGPVTNPTVTNLTVNRYMTIETTLAVGEQIIIDMKNRTIIKNGQNLYSAKADGSLFWWLDKGNNDIHFNTADTSDTGNIEIRYRDSYLGI